MSWRATITRDDGKEDDWGFEDLLVSPYGVITMRMADGTKEFIAPGTWREIRDVIEED